MHILELYLNNNNYYLTIKCYFKKLLNLKNDHKTHMDTHTHKVIPDTKRTSSYKCDQQNLKSVCWQHSDTAQPIALCGDRYIVRGVSPVK